LIVAIAVVTGFLAQVDPTITAAGRGTVAEAGIVVRLIPIVTSFALLDHPIATGGRLTLGAGIGGILIAIVAALTGTHNAIAADVKLAVRPAGIVVDVVAVITGLVTGHPLAQVQPNDTVAAAGRHAPGATSIGILGVTIIALLVAIIPLGAIQTDHTVAATGQHTGREAGIAVLGIAIVALLSALLAHGQIHSSDRITTEGHLAGLCALIGVVLIAVIALLALLDLSITAAGLGLPHHHLLTGTRAQKHNQAQYREQTSVHRPPP
tara:strand:- start:239 stop:1036 length:798 start_codon:yes stop_codon:yes gene_type:complete